MYFEPSQPQRTTGYWPKLSERWERWVQSFSSQVLILLNLFFLFAQKSQTINYLFQTSCARMRTSALAHSSITNSLQNLLPHRFVQDDRDSITSKEEANHGGLHMLSHMGNKFSQFTKSWKKSFSLTKFNNLINWALLCDNEFVPLYRDNHRSRESPSGPCTHICTTKFTTMHRAKKGAKAYKIIKSRELLCHCCELKLNGRADTLLKRVSPQNHTMTWTALSLLAVRMHQRGIKNVADGWAPKQKPPHHSASTHNSMLIPYYAVGSGTSWRRCTYECDGTK